MKRPSPVVYAGVIFCFAAVLALGKWGPVGAFADAVQARTAAPPGAPSGGAVPVFAPSEDLCEQAAREAPEQRVEPVDARIDPVWKAIPGYDGREADVEATCERIRSMGKDVARKAGIPWVYRPVHPAVGLDDLPPAPVYRGNPAKPAAAIMINVAWGDEHLPAMLNTLEEEGVAATFFLDGTWLSKHRDLAAEILARGHELSNHAWSHPMMSRLADSRQREEIVKTENLLKELGAGNRWFAPPSGDYDQRTVRIAHSLGLRTVLWTLDTIDWKNPPPDAVVQKVARRAEPGVLILMHPTDSAKRALPGIIRALRGKGLVPGTVSHTLSSERIEPPS
ncbi:MAG: hypothetical protein BAA02_07785 [Paenibacillaceae bacterium ZCTH02-B3]|nr:MAG: hypothetical protein BAA02_07785 [Paenibacillaceae bacterium ZCTH02-B3]